MIIKKIKSHHKIMWSYSWHMLASLTRPIFVFLIFASFTVMSVCALLFYSLEAGTNQELGSLLDSFYFTVTTMTGVGYGDITPITTAGKILSIGMMLGGTVLYVTFTATLATTLFEFYQQEQNEKK